MPLHQINVTPVDAFKDTEKQYDVQVGVQSSKSNESYGRSESQASSQTSTNVDICRICHCEGDTESSLIAPCYCSGSLRYVHQSCLQQWIKSSNIRCCELCKFQFIMHTKTKPFTEWEPLEMTGFERRKLLCAVTFHAVAFTCVVWSLYVLIVRTAEEIKSGAMDWPFWTKLVVVAIGFTGGVLFMYIQCKAYLHVWMRWKAFNRVIYVQNAPEKQPLPAVPMMVGGGIASSRDSVPGAFQAESKTRPYQEPTNYKEETSIDLKGVRNVHIFFNDENRVCVQNDKSCGLEDGEHSTDSVNLGASGGQRNDDPLTSWHIKIEKGSSPETSSAASLRCGEGEALVNPNEFSDQGFNKSNLVEEYTGSKGSDANKGDSVLKLQINKKAEIVIKFGQKSSGDALAEEAPSSESKDASVNIKIEDKESDPIVIDVVKKLPNEPKDPVQIRKREGE